MEGNRNQGKNQVVEVPTIYCQRGQTIWEAAAAYGYKPPLYRIAVHDSRPMDGEKLIARVKAERHSRPILVFLRGGDK